MASIAKGFARARAGSGDLRTVDPRVAVADDGTAADESGTVANYLDMTRIRQVRLSTKHLAEQRVITDGVSAASAAYKMLRTRVLQRMRRNGWKSLAITGTCPNEGKSLTAINLSIALARDHETSVVLTDLDLRKPSLHRHLGVQPDYSIHDFLRGAAPLHKVAVRPGIDRLGVILNDRPVRDSSELLSSPAIGSLVDTVQSGPDRIAIFDLPPVLASDDMLAFCPYVDAVLLVVAPGTTRRSDMSAALDLIEDMDLVGIVLNGSSEDVAPYYYYGRSK
jgi:Mrp family chromosome partitioning ATPase